MACALWQSEQTADLTLCLTSASLPWMEPVYSSSSSLWHLSPHSAAEFAAARGATVLAVYGGAGLVSNGYHIAQPEPEGISVSRAIGFALEDAGYEVMS